MKLTIRDNFYLSSTHPNDKAAYLEHFIDKSISDAIPCIPYPYTESDADWWIQRRLKFLRENGKEISFALRNPEGYLIGSIGVDDLKIGETHRAEVGYWLAKPYRGQGLVSDALGVFIKYAFSNLEVTRLTAHTLDFNKASARILEKQKFKLEGCLRQHTKTQNGLFDTLAWGLLKIEQVLENAFNNQRSELQVEGQGIVIQILSDDLDGSRHQRFIIRLSSGQTLLITHNIDIAPRIDSLQEGDTISFYGEYEWNSQGGLIHWTHRDPHRNHTDGWIE